MAKRFTDTDKYKKPFFRGLPGPYKLLWDYLYHSCDHAGIWIVDFEIAQIYLGSDMPVNKVDALKYFNSGEERIIVLNSGSKWFIPDFIVFQYGELSEKNRAHNSVIHILDRYGLFKNKVLIRSLQGRKDKDKDMDKDKDKERHNFQKPKPEEVQEYLDSLKFKGFNGQYFVDKNDSVGWVVGKNKSPMKDWKAVVRTWIDNNKKKEVDYDIL